MTEQEALARMVPPGARRAGKYREGVIQIWITRACDKACYGCTQGSNLGGKPGFITPSQFERAVKSLVGYFGVVGVFGGNPAMHPEFEGLCDILAKYIPREQRGLWCNNPIGKGPKMRDTFNPAVSNLNVHMDQKAYDEFKRDWPESMPFGLTADSRHSPPYVAMKDVLLVTCPKCQGEGKGQSDHDTSCELPTITCDVCNGTGKVYDHNRAWDLISNCDINQHWSAMIGVFRGKLRAWFCEIAGAQAMLHQHDEDYPDTGLPIHEGFRYAVEDPGKPHQVSIYKTDDGGRAWWELPMGAFATQVRKHCHECGVPLRGYGELAQATDGKEQVSRTHQDIYSTKRVGRKVELVTREAQLGRKLNLITDYMGNAKR